MTKVTVTDPEQIPNLPWKGNWAADQWLFDAIDDYVARESDPRKQYAASRYASIHGMGADLPVTPTKDDLEYMRELYDPEGKRDGITLTAAETDVLKQLLEIGGEHLLEVIRHGYSQAEYFEVERKLLNLEQKLGINLP